MIYVVIVLHMAAWISVQYQLCVAEVVWVGLDSPVANGDATFIVFVIFYCLIHCSAFALPGLCLGCHFRTVTIGRCVKLRLRHLLITF